MDDDKVLDAVFSTNTRQSQVTKSTADKKGKKWLRVMVVLDVKANKENNKPLNWGLRYPKSLKQAHNGRLPSCFSLGCQVFSEKLQPLLAQLHLDLLLATLGIESSLASHAEHNNQDIKMTDLSVSCKLSRPKRNHNSSHRSSADSPDLIKPNGTSLQQKAILSKVMVISVILLDEALINFWSDAAIDLISSH
ncbi:hypothetical protein PILCRDRAFT_787716 [Piloderma croceum F 1598]|uniref:Uncharacterized protein n=1 Tax=Piloderma croceum (strain F 1598) TaxID=765440 RepID=A0A0C3FPN0_PILCF|nr:hypothetical protein PILCRDRAFT_787716 [Piloderma croceum F 1598]